MSADIWISYPCGSGVIRFELPHLLIETPPLWYRIVEPALLAIGLLGSVLSSKVLRFVGWVGICCFFLVLMSAMPDLDHADPELREAPTL
jgi:hypothetical protein